MAVQMPSEITRILQEWNEGETGARNELLRVVYDELKRQARLLMSRERNGHTLQPTALVHEAFLRIEASSGIVWQDRRHFYGIASRLMRQILVDHARRKTSGKRGSRVVHFSIDDIDLSVDDRAGSLVAINDALDRLAEIDPKQAEIVEMRFFGGLTIAEIAETLGVSERTVAREWQTARLWLFREFSGDWT
jgi:RNA polymerase sigma factor (TIGR02999 family)